MEYGADKAINEVVDGPGYHGTFIRGKKKLEKMSAREFLAVICDGSGFAKVMRTIREIDKERNGYITNQELDDILRMYYPHELSDKDIEAHIHKFTSPLNRVLVDYKHLQSTVE